MGRRLTAKQLHILSFASRISGFDAPNSRAKRLFFGRNVTPHVRRMIASGYIEPHRDDSSALHYLILTEDGRRALSESQTANAA